MKNCIQEVNEPPQHRKPAEEEAAGSNAKTRMSFARFTRPWRMFTLLLAAFPLLLILALHFYALEAMVSLGHWPSYENPNPKQLGGWLRLQYPALAVGLMNWPMASLMSIALAIFGRVSSRDFPIWTVIITAIVSFALFMAWGWFDPGGLGTWFMD